MVSDDLNTFAYDANVAGSGMHGGRVGSVHQALPNGRARFEWKDLEKLNMVYYV